MNLKELNKFGQKVSKITKKISDVNAVNEAVVKGNLTPGKRKLRNKVKNGIFNKLK